MLDPVRPVWIDLAHLVDVAFAIEFPVDQHLADLRDDLAMNARSAPWVRLWWRESRYRSEGDKIQARLKKLRPV